MSNKQMFEKIKQNQILTTCDYRIFKKLPGNRGVNQMEVKRLEQSMAEKNLFSLVIVNEYHQIVDGQHRFEAARNLGLPIDYIIREGYGLEDVQRLNTNGSNWKRIDYLNAHCDLNIEPYVIMRKFMNDYPDFGLSVAESFLTNRGFGANTKGKIRGSVGYMRNFEQGRLFIPNLQKSYNNADKVLMFKPYYDGYNRNLFVATMISLFENPAYNHAEMIKKLKLQPSAIVHCTCVKQYKLVLEQIYNYKNRNKVSLRY